MLHFIIDQAVKERRDEIEISEKHIFEPSRTGWAEVNLPE